MISDANWQMVAWAGHELEVYLDLPIEAKSPTSRKKREKWGTRFSGAAGSFVPNGDGLHPQPRTVSTGQVA
jgi:hypothetical protein